MYESPIKLLMTDIHHQIMEQQENEIYKAVLHCVPDIDKAELIRALQYDREQYDKGYADGKKDAMAELVRCGECIHYEPCEAGKDFCCFHAIGIVKDDFCSYGERREGDA